MKRYFALGVVLMALIMSCDNDEIADENVSDISFDFQFVTDDGTIQLNEPFELNGSTVQFEVANFYFYDLEMGKSGSNLTLADERTHVLAGANLTTSFSDLNVAPFDLISTKITIGVEESQNNQSEADFTERRSDDPLSIKDPSMHWNWNSGYKFVRFDGEVDTDGDGVVDTPIAYHLGSDAMRTDLIITQDKLEIGEGKNNLTMVFNLDEFFKDVDFQEQSNWDTHTGNNMPLAEQLRDNLRSSMSISK